MTLKWPDETPVPSEAIVGFGDKKLENSPAYYPQKAVNASSNYSEIVQLKKRVEALE